MDIAGRAGDDRQVYASLKEVECRGFVERVLGEWSHQTRERTPGQPAGAYTERSAAHIRPALDADAEAAVEVLRRSITEVCLADHQNDAPTLERWLLNKTPEQFRSWRSWPDNFLVVANCAGIICGVGSIRESGDLELLYVHPSYQRRGIGRAILMVLESRAREWGVPTIRLTTSATARSFYEHFGYEFLPEESSPGYGVLYDYRYRKLLS